MALKAGVVCLELQTNVELAYKTRRTKVDLRSFVIFHRHVESSLYIEKPIPVCYSLSLGLNINILTLIHCLSL